MASREPRQQNFRSDIEGLRAVAVALVVAFHAGLRGITGGYVGVDVFFVISGFLISGLLVEELQRTGSISFASFYARRACRLLPMATLVLAAVAIAMAFFTPPVFRPAVRFDAISAALYYSNWQFALESVNYLTLGAAQNPVLHYWSLSVEEQFYLAWPALLVVAVGRRVRGSRSESARRRRLVAAVAAVGLASFVYSVIATPADPAVSYFATTTRVWEFAVGAAVALLTPALARMTPIVSLLIGVAGLVALVASAFVYGPTTEFPGTAALIPVLGAAAVIAAGLTRPTLGAGRLLSARPLRYIGRISYSWYLWHWPCLVFAGSARWAPVGGRIGWVATTLAVALSLALAATTHALIEAPLRRSQWLAASRRRVFLLAGAATATAVLALAIVGGPLAGSGSISDLTAVTRTAPTPIAAQSSTPYESLHGCHVGYDATEVARGCSFGDPAARRTVVLLGDSHAAQWFPALDELANREGFRLVSWTKSGCPFVLGVHIFLPAIGRDYHECLAWQASVLGNLRALPRPAMIIVARTSTYLPQVLTAESQPATSRQAARLWGAGAAASFAALRPLSARVVILRDTPRPPFDVPACISWDPSTPQRCDFNRRASPHSDAGEYSAERDAGVPFDAYADPTSVVCPGLECHVFVDGVIVFRDDNHLTAAFSALRWRQLAASLNRRPDRRAI